MKSSQTCAKIKLVKKNQFVFNFKNYVFKSSFIPTLSYGSFCRIIWIKFIELVERNDGKLSILA